MMANAGYDKSIGSEDRSVVAQTKLWGIVIGIVLLLGIGMLVFFLMSDNKRDSGGVSSGNTATRPAEP